MINERDGGSTAVEPVEFIFTPEEIDAFGFDF